MTGAGDAGRRAAHQRYGTGPDPAEVEAGERLAAGVPEPGDAGRMMAGAKFRRDEKARQAIAEWRGRQRR